VVARPDASALPVPGGGATQRRRRSRIGVSLHLSLTFRKPAMTSFAPTSRRHVLLAAAASLAAAPGVAEEAAFRPTDPALTAVSAANPLVLQKTELVYEAIFDLLPTLQLGN